MTSAPTTNAFHELAPGLFVQTRDLRFLGVETGARCTLIRLASGGVFVHSPGPLDEEVRALVDRLGPVTAIAAPSLFHHLCAGDWKQAYPDALLCACPGLDRKRADLPWDLTLGDEAHALWKADLEQVFFGARTMENEVVFFHAASRSLVCCDIVFHLSEHPSLLTRLAGRLLGNGKPGATWLEHIMIRRRDEAREQIDRILSWDFDRIVLSHGPIIETGGREILRRAYAWL